MDRAISAQQGATCIAWIDAAIADLERVALARSRDASMWSEVASNWSDADVG